ncbi:MAG: amidohydrolase family protein, partial [Marmoricola sp.]
MTKFLLEHALVDGVVLHDVGIEVDGGTITSVDTAPCPDTLQEVVRGLTIPALANCHSHAFHRALRGRTQQGTGSFWTWREQMYAVAARLDPDSYLALARATFREMVAAGYTSVGEFHYVHHRPDG